MPPAISPNTVGSLSYTVSDSVNAWFYLDVDLGVGEQGDLEVHCPATATLTLTEGAGAPITLSTTDTLPTDTTTTRTVDSSGVPQDGDAIVVVMISATNPFHTAWVLRVGEVASSQTVRFQVNAGNVRITRILADPVVSAPAPAPLIEKRPISLTGTGNYTTVPPGAGPAGTAALPVLRARWTQINPAAISAPPPDTVFSSPGDSAPVTATLSASPAFTAPAVSAERQLEYRLTVFYDDIANMIPDPSEPIARADVTLTVKPSPPPTDVKITAAEQPLGMPILVDFLAAAPIEPVPEGAWQISIRGHGLPGSFFGPVGRTMDVIEIPLITDDPPAALQPGDVEVVRIPGEIDGKRSYRAWIEFHHRMVRVFVTVTAPDGSSGNDVAHVSHE